MDLQSLRIFLSLSNALHFGKASQDCNLSPSALSRAIQRLEDEVGCELFLRDNRSVELSAAGVRFRLYAQEALDAWESVRVSLSTSDKPLTGEIVLYCSVAASYTVLSVLFRAFREQYPGIQVRLQTGDPAAAIAKVQAGEADISVAAHDRLPQNLVFKPVAVTPLLFIAPVAPCKASALTSGPKVPWERVPMVLSETGLSRKRTNAWFRAKGVRPTVYAEVSGHEAVLSMVRLGCGVGIIPKIVLDRFALANEVRVLKAEPPLEPYTLGLCVHRRRLQSPPVKAFWEIAVAETGNAGN